MGAHLLGAGRDHNTSLVIIPSSLRERWMGPRVDNEKQLYNSNTHHVHM
jgi:hypothetical protein